MGCQLGNGLKRSTRGIQKLQVVQRFQPWQQQSTDCLLHGGKGFHFQIGEMYNSVPDIEFIATFYSKISKQKSCSCENINLILAQECFVWFSSCSCWPFTSKAGAKLCQTQEVDGQRREERRRRRKRGDWSSLIIYLRGKEGSQGEQIVFLPEPSPSDPSAAYLKPKPHRISEILIWWHFNILPWWLFSNIYFRRSRALPPEEMKHVKTHYEKIKI